tara:strand:- start:475 stop:702 length:228 start_codon:yes stop_codon:yes gene_type:complete
MGHSQKIATLLEERQNIEREIAKIQELCHHPLTSVKFVRERLDSTTMIIRHTCDECSSIVGIPNALDLENFLKQN